MAFEGFLKFIQFGLNIRATILQIQFLLDNGASFDTPGVSGGIQVSGEKNMFDFSLCVKDAVITVQGVKAISGKMFKLIFIVFI